MINSKLLIFFALIFTFLQAKDIKRRLKDGKYHSNEVQKFLATTDVGSYVFSESTDSFIYVSITLSGNNDKKIEEFISTSKIVLDQNGGTVRLDVLTNGAKGDLLYEIAIPKNIEIDISTKDSKILVQNTSNNIRIVHQSESITLENILSGSINISSKNAKIIGKNVNSELKIVTSKDIDVESSGGSVDFSTSGDIKFSSTTSIPTTLLSQNGVIEVNFPKNGGYTLNIHSNGNIQHDLKNIQFEGSLGSNIITGILNKKNTPLNVSALKGKIYLNNNK